MFWNFDKTFRNGLAKIKKWLLNFRITNSRKYFKLTLDNWIVKNPKEKRLIPQSQENMKYANTLQQAPMYVYAIIRVYMSVKSLECMHIFGIDAYYV